MQWVCQWTDLSIARVHYKDNKNKGHLRAPKAKEKELACNMETHKRVPFHSGWRYRNWLLGDAEVKNEMIEDKVKEKNIFIEL